MGQPDVHQDRGGDRQPDHQADEPAQHVDLSRHGRGAGRQVPARGAGDAADHDRAQDGKPRVSPLLYLHNSNQVITITSRAAWITTRCGTTTCRWNPDIEVQIGSEIQADARGHRHGGRKQAYWPRLLEMYRDYADYQARTERDIPVVILSPR